MSMQMFIRLLRQYIAAERQMGKSYREAIAALIAMRIEYAQVNDGLSLADAQAQVEAVVHNEYPGLSMTDVVVPF